MESRASKYEGCFDTAFAKYGQQLNRPGYGFGWFSWARHSCELYPHIQDLKNRLKNADSLFAEAGVLKQYFLSPLTTFNNHSFAIYLLDSLLTSYPSEKFLWEGFYPPEKKLIFYTGLLYRGMRISEWQLRNFFENGINSLESSIWVDDYAKDTTMGLGISTSKSESVASNYACGMVTRGIAKEAGQIHIIPGYLIQIHYRGEGGIDIIPTLQARGENFNAYLGDTKKEVNIVGAIEACDIVGARYCGGDMNEIKKGFIKNPNFIENKKMMNNVIEMPQRLEKLFNENQSKRFMR